MIDDLARTAVDDLRSSTTSDVETGLREVYAGHRDRRRQTLRAGAAAVAVAVGLGWWGGYLASDRSPAPAQPAEPPPVDAPSAMCVGRIECLDDSTYRFALTRPVVWEVPRGYGVDTTPSDWLVETYSQGEAIAGVTVVEGVRAPVADGTSARNDVPDSPRAFVSWLAEQPFVDASRVVPTRIDGRAAWHVRVTVRRGFGGGPATCSGRFNCHATTISPDGWSTGIWDDMVADYTAFRLPGTGTTVVWSWAFGRDRAALTRNQAAVDGLSWPDR